MIVTASLPRSNQGHGTRPLRCDSIELKTEITAETFDQGHQFFGWIDQLETGIETIRADIGAAPATEGIKIDVAGTFNFTGQLDSKLKHAVGKQRNVADQAQTLGGYIDDITNRLSGFAVIHAEIVL